MANTISFIGKIMLGKDSDKFHPVDRRTFASSWTNTTVKFNCISDTNRVMCTVQGGRWQSDAKNVIKTFSKPSTDANGNTTKGEMIDIPWAKRFDADQLDRIVDYRKFICDTGDSRMRYKLQNIVDGKAEIDDALIAAGVDSVEAAKVALEKSKAKRREFASEWDFAEHLAKVLQSGKYANKLFKLTGMYDIAYNADKQRYYTTYHVNRVFLMPDDAVSETTLKVDFFFSEDSFDDSQYEETGKAYVNGWVNYYDSSVKANGFMPLTVTVKENEKKIAGLKRKFSCESDEIKQVGLTLKVVDGSERVEITIDMLTEEEQEDIACGILDFEEVKRAMNNSVVGERISELRFVELTPRKSTVQDTVYHLEDMHEARAKVVDEVEDIFASDDEDDL